jgi:PAS domain S-box-containing protein
MGGQPRINEGVPAAAVAGPPEEFDLESVIDIDAVQALMNDFHALTGLPMWLVDLQGRVLVAVGWTDLCSNFHRTRPDSLALCRENEVAMRRDVEAEGFSTRTCANGLANVALPLVVSDAHVGDIMAGQFFYDDEQPAGDFFERRAERYGFDREAYLRAVADVPRLSRETVGALVSFYARLAEQIAQAGYANLVLDRANEERGQALEALAQSEDKFKYVFDHSVVGKSITFATGEIHVNEAFAQMVGRSREDLEERSWREITHPDDIATTEDEMGALIAGQKASARYQKRFIHTDGSIVWADVSSSLRRDDEGRPRYFVTTLLDISERKRAEEALLESAQLNQQIIDSAHEGVIVYGKDLRYQVFNPFMEALTGFEVSDVLGRLPWEVSSVLEGTGVVERLESALRGAVPDPVEFFYEVSGRSGWVIDTSAPLRSASGEIIGVVATVQDITERKSAESALVASEDKFRSAFAVSPEAMNITRATDGMILDVNEGFTAITGYERDEVVGKTALEIPVWDNPSDRERLVQGLRNCGRVDGMIGPFRRKDGQIRTGRMSARLMDVDGVPHILAASADITQEAKARAELLDSREQLRATIEQAAVGISRVGLDGAWLDANDALCSMLGYSAEELRGRRFSDVTHPDDVGKDIEALDQLGRGEMTEYHTEKRYIAKDGRIIWTKLAVTLAWDADGTPAYTVAVTDDITERKHAEDALLETNTRLESVLKSITETMGKIVEVRDPYTQGHERRVAKLARLLGEEMGLDANGVDSIEVAALVHDIGKLSVPVEILNKPGRLSANEFTLIKEHSRAGHDILSDIDFGWPIADIVLQHHERIDGSGYPDALVGDSILLAARVLAVADVIEAMASHRPYRPAIGLDAAVQEITSHPAQFDPQVTAACVRVYESGQMAAQLL